MCESKVEKGLSHETKCTSCKDAQLAERKLLLCSPLAREEFRKRNSFFFWKGRREYGEQSICIFHMHIRRQMLDKMDNK